MPIQLRCPGCGKVYRLADDRAGKQAQCPCGAVMKVPARASKDSPAWEDEVNRAFGPSPAPEPQETGLKETLPLPSCAAAKARGHDAPRRDDPSRGPHPAATGSGDPRPTSGKKPAAVTPSSLSSRIAAFARLIFAGVKKEPWRAVFGLAAFVYGAVTATVILSSVSLRSVDDLLFGSAPSRLAQAAVTGAIAFGGLLILKKDTRGPACAGLAAAIYCFVPMWGLFPGLRLARDAAARPAPLARRRVCRPRGPDGLVPQGGDSGEGGE